MLRNLIPAIISPGRTLSTLAFSQNMRLAGVFVDNNFTSTLMTFQTQLPSGQQFAISDGSGGTLTRTVRPNDYIPLADSNTAGVDRVLFGAATSQVGVASTLMAVFISA